MERTPDCHAAVWGQLPFGERDLLHYVPNCSFHVGNCYDSNEKIRNCYNSNEKLRNCLGLLVDYCAVGGINNKNWDHLQTEIVLM